MTPEQRAKIPCQADKHIWRFLDMRHDYTGIEHVNGYNREYYRFYCQFCLKIKDMIKKRLGGEK